MLGLARVKKIFVIPYYTILWCEKIYNKSESAGVGAERTLSFEITDLKIQTKPQRLSLR
jgi:hypothetical protein